MPTKPLQKLLDRDFSKVAAKEIIHIASPLLQELINYATNAWRRCDSSTSGAVNEDVAVLLLYLHIIEQTDGIDVLLRHSCPVPAIPLLRSCFEALLYMEYILESEADYATRSLSWLAGYAHDRLGVRSALDATTGRGRSIQRDLKADRIARRLTWPTSAQAQKAMQPLQKLLARPELQRIEAEYGQFKKRPAWYRLFGGPQGIDGLARYLNRYAQYEFLYRNWSSIAHAADASRFIAATAAGERAIWSLRNPNRFKNVALLATYFILDATTLMLKKFRPGEDIRPWYVREVRERFVALRALQVTVDEIV